ncbi:MAG: hypothetical protein LLG01_17745 [Planctomycetaceae bacterium]|nr:hypothetical protein [Planctomycetaceae bacterium]
MEVLNDILARRVKAAAGAAWWTLLIMVIILTGAWIGVLLVTHQRPEWVGNLIGGKIDWDQIHTMYLWFFGAMKMILWVVFMLSVWLSIWARKLRRIARQTSPGTPV